MSPVPAQPIATRRASNLIERDYWLKLALGLPADVFTRGATLLAATRG